uniref:Uncharacterized protein n=1 Tax=Ralstonia solanacearum TaxID=305 RepID=A0A0S4WJN1_RALSL|nr:protein of unknown function [Ralstonia solanacearum]
MTTARAPACRGDAPRIRCPRWRLSWSSSTPLHRCSTGSWVLLGRDWIARWVRLAGRGGVVRT